MWKLDEDTQQLKLWMPALVDGGKSGHVELCAAQGTQDRPILRLADCSLIDSSADADADAEGDAPTEGGSASDAMKLDDKDTQAEAAKEAAAEAAELAKGGVATRSLSAARKVQRKIEVTDAPSDEITFLKVSMTDDGKIFDHNTGMCVGLRGDVREPGALLELSPCVDTGKKSASAHQHFTHHAHTGEVVAKKVEGGLCLTAGWPFLSAAAFTNSEKKETIIVVMNEATLPTSIALSDAHRSTTLGFAIFGRAIQTIVYRS